ncbi:MAG: heme exporter protein CcmD [Alphaproteobacteria bacterium]
MEDIAAFLNMDGHAAFVWPSLGIATLILAAMAIISVRQLRQSESTLRAAEAASPVRRRRTEKEAD